MVNVFCILKVQVVRTSMSLRIQIIISVTTYWQLWWILHHYQVFNQYSIFLKDASWKKSLKSSSGVSL